jgi:general nucleoside transport system ATP-binding protein
MTVIALSEIAKTYGAVRALHDVSLTLQRGEVHALLGENGAGKSTLLAILSGLVQPDAGTIAIDGFPTRISSPADAFRAGIATVFQHFTLVPPMTVAENLRLGLSQSGWISNAELSRRLATIGLDIPLAVPVEAITVGQRQHVEIAKALLRRPRVLLLDEPTSVLAGAEIDHLLDLIRSIANHGAAVVLVTHKLNEALAVADRVTVLRRGKVSGEINLKASPERRPSLSDRLIAMMFGGREPLPEAVPHHSSATDESRVVVRLREISARDDRGGPALQQLSLEVTAGEVLGIAGVDGNGQQELAEVLSGERSVESGSLEINGRPMTNVGARALIDAGVGVTTAERIAVGCVPGTSLATNLALKHISSPPFAEGFRLHHFEIRQFARDLIARFDIQPGNPEQPITELSGGNIQRALLGRELAFRPDLLVCHQPTAGLDVFTAEQMLARIHEAAGEGAAVLLISSDLDELLRHCDRIAVIYRGTIAGILTRAGFDPDHIARLMVTGQVEAA